MLGAHLLHPLPSSGRSVSPSVPVPFPGEWEQKPRPGAGYARCSQVPLLLGPQRRQRLGMDARLLTHLHKQVYTYLYISYLYLH